MFTDFKNKSKEDIKRELVNKYTYVPNKLSFCANFTSKNRSYNIKLVTPTNRTNDRKMKGDMLAGKMPDRNMVGLDHDMRMQSDNPIYEDPRDVLAQSKTMKKRNMQAMTTPPNRERKTAIKEYKKKLSKKYEGLIVTLMERCEESVLVINEKETQLSKLKSKLKEVLSYNKLFAEENDRLKDEHSAMINYVEECKQMICELNDKNKELIARINAPKDYVEEMTAVPMVEVCMSCSNREILLRQSRDHNTRLQQDMKALKEVLYRLNVQLSRYQEKLRAINKESYEAAVLLKPGSDNAALDSAVTYKGLDNDDRSSKGQDGDHQAKMVDLTGLVSAQALGPLFDAYQESIQEKELLIMDYEKQFEGLNRKTKAIVDDNKEHKEKLQILEEEITLLRGNVKKLTVERETLELERDTLLERCEKSETKLKEVYEVYEDKVSAMMRDYETVHREYFATKSALSISDNKVAQLEGALRTSGHRTVPADLHERRVDNCKRLLEDLKHQYSMENERKSELISKLESERSNVSEKYKQLSDEHDRVKCELKDALKNAGLYRKAAVIFRQRYKTSVATINMLRRRNKRVRVVRQVSPSVAQALERLEKIKQEIKLVKARAYSSLEELERRIRCQTKRSERAQQEYQRELERASLVVQHKERIIRSLIDKVADVEEVRLSQSNTHRLQGMPDCSPEHAEETQDRREPIRLVPGSSGYFQDDTKNK